MKLSWKFFCIAYMIALLSTGIGSAWLIQKTLDMSWESLEERVRTSEYYALNSFLSFAESSKSVLSEKECLAIRHQIMGIMDECIDEFEIIPAKNGFDERYTELSINEGYDQFIKDGDKLLMEVVCKVENKQETYVVRVAANFAQLLNERQQIWMDYCIIVLIMAVISGGLLYIIVGKMTKPLKELTEVSNAIAQGNYGKVAQVDTSNLEIADLARSFNTMSLATENALNETRLAYERRERFVADFAHEMKTPMTSIIGYSDLMKSYELSETEKIQASEAIYREAVRLEHLSHQMLELLVLQNETVSMDVISLSTIKKHLEEHLKFVSEKYNVGFNIYFLDLYVYGNESLIMSLLYNLADNGFKASNPGQHIDIFAIPEEDWITFCVQDYGHGIAPEHMEHLTEEFYREDKARSRKVGGAGLGLSICKEIANLHDTKLGFESRQGTGTKVSFTLRKAGEYNE